MEKSEYSFWLALDLAKGMSNRAKVNIVVKCFKSGCSLPDAFIDHAACTGENSLTPEESAFLDKVAPDLPQAGFLVEDLYNQGYELTPLLDLEYYPETVKKAMGTNAPLLLYTKGNRALLKETFVSIVGSRKAGPQALQFTDVIARKAVADNKVVVSGYAKGVDQQALFSALDAMGKSIVVLPQGITTFGTGYRTLYKPIYEGRVLVLSYFPPKAGWHSGLAMARNEMIYAFANDIYVAESDSHGGTWSGATAGIRAGRKKVFVRVPEKEEKTANKELIALGGIPVDAQGVELNRDDVIEDPAKVEEQILGLLKGQPFTPAEIIEKLHLEWTEMRMKQKLVALAGKGVVETKKNRKKAYWIPSNEGSLF